jgi:hypothetical protein
MEETVSVFDWNFIYGIALGAFIIGICWYLWATKKSGRLVVKGIKRPPKAKAHKKGELPDSDWPNASWDDVELKADAQINPKHLATVTPSNHESHLG